MIVFISGPMSGLPNNNYPAFDAAAERLRSEGHSVVNPAESSRYMMRMLQPPVATNTYASLESPTWFDYMGIALSALQAVDAFLQLPGWQNSYGARIEALVAEKMSLKEIK